MSQASDRRFDRFREYWVKPCTYPAPVRCDGCQSLIMPRADRPEESLRLTFAGDTPAGVYHQRCLPELQHA